MILLMMLLFTDLFGFAEKFMVQIKYLLVLTIVFVCVTVSEP